MRVAKSYCRICFAYCGVNVTIDKNDKIVSIRGDHDNPGTMGYACIKGLEAASMIQGDKRLTHPLKRVGDSFERIGLEQALDEIADRMKVIRAESGADALAFHTGTGMTGSTIGVFAVPALSNALGAQRYSTMTIDQSAKWVTAERLGTWGAGRHRFGDSEVFLFAGMNPLVTGFSWHTPVQNPVKRMKMAKTAGTRIIVIDPRKSDMAQFADIHLQIYPGEDVAVAAGLIRIVLANGWVDAQFCEDHVEGLEALREAVAPFTPEMVAARAGIAGDDLIAAARLFAHECRRGSVSTGTGSNMAAFPNTSEHLYEALGVICGRFLREGEVLPNSGVLLDKQARAEVVGPARSFEALPKSRIRGAIQLMGEKPTATLPEEILTPGKGQVRSLFVAAANPVGSVPEPGKVIEAMRALDLLVVMDPFMSATAQMADYVLPPRVFYERPDMTYTLEMMNLDFPYSQHSEAILSDPPGSELCDEGHVLWSLAKRLGVTLTFDGVEMDMETPPSDDDFLAILARNSRIPFDEYKQQAAGGRIFEAPERLVEPAGPEAGRFAVMPEDVAAEVAAYLESGTEDHGEPGLLLVPRRIRETINTTWHDLPSTRRRTPFNPLFIHPADLDAIGMATGDSVDVASQNGSIRAILKADETMKPGVVSMTHGFGGKPGDNARYEDRGSSTCELVSLTHGSEPLQAMPLMSGIPVRISRVHEVA